MEDKIRMVEKYPFGEGICRLAYNTVRIVGTDRIWRHWEMSVFINYLQNVYGKQLLF